MKSLNTMKKGLLSSAAAALLMASTLSADCTYQLFSISSNKGTSISEFVDQLSDECAFSVIVSDSEAEKVLNKALNKTNLKNLTIDEVLNLILSENNLSYTLESNILKISYLKTETFNVDYIISRRASTGSTNITLSSESGMSGAEGADTSNIASGTSETAIAIATQDEVIFWDTLTAELTQVLNRPEDVYTAGVPIINKNSGMITVSATAKQLKRLKTYLEELQQKIQYQVLIDVNIFSVTLNDARSTGVDWSQLYALQNLQMTVDYLSAKDVTEVTDGKISSWGPLPPDGETASIFTLQGAGDLKEVIKFLKTQGDLKSVSNPKVLTLNNQPALITVGTEYFYKVENTTQQAASGGGVAATLQTTVVNSVFAGVLLDITPEIAHDGQITLKINPSVSQTRAQMGADNSDRTMPPDLDRRQLASVITVKDGNRVVLGGLINTRKLMDENKVPLLGDIPALGYFFKYEEMVQETEELVLIIRPTIIKKDSNSLSLAELGYKGLTAETVDSNFNTQSKEANEK